MARIAPPRASGAALNTTSGRVLGAVYNTSTTSLGASTAAVSLAGGGLSKTVTVGARPLLISWGGMAYHTVAGGSPYLLIFEDGVQIDLASATSAAANALVNLTKQRIFQPSAGNHTYEVKLGQATAVATCALFGHLTFPVYLHVVEG